MANFNNEKWQKKFQAYAEYVDTYHKLPTPYTVYKDEKIGVWLRNQIVSYSKGKLPKENSDQLFAHNPHWNGSVTEKIAERKRMLINSDWKKTIPASKTPIDAYITDENELFLCIQDGIFTCEQWIDVHFPNCVNSRDSMRKIFDCFSKIKPYHKPEYAHLIFDMYDVHYLASPETRTLDEKYLSKIFKDLPTSSPQVLERLIDTSLEKLSVVGQKVIRMRYGIGYEMCYPYKKIGEECEVSGSRAQAIKLESIRRLRKNLTLLYKGLETPVYETDVRNMEIYTAVSKGESHSSVAKRYNISRQRVADICKKKAKLYARESSDALYCRIGELCDNSLLQTKIYNLLKRNNITSIEAARALTESDFKNMRQCGDVVKGLIKRI